MSEINIETLIRTDLETFLNFKNHQGNLTIESASEIASYVGANFLRIIFSKNKELKKEELNGVFGIISNVYNDLFEGQFSQSDFENISKKALDLLSDTNFDQNSKIFFLNLINNAQSN